MRRDVLAEENAIVFVRNPVRDHAGFAVFRVVAICGTVRVYRGAFLPFAKTEKTEVTL